MLLRAAIVVAAVIVVLIIANWPTYTAVAPAVAVSDDCAGRGTRDGTPLTVVSRVSLMVCARLNDERWFSMQGTLRVENIGGRVEQTERDDAGEPSPRASP